jgi:hypothetical protein
MKPDPVSLAIGRKGVIIKLAQDVELDFLSMIFRDNEGRGG